MEAVEKMLPHQIFAIAAPTLARSFHRWILNLGALGFIPLGLLDSSVIPVPGSMDVLIIILSARNEKLWLLYAVMATIGSVIGAYVTYRVARKGGKETLERKFPARTMEKVQRSFSRWGFGAIHTASQHARQFKGRRSVADVVGVRIIRIITRPTTSAPFRIRCADRSRTRTLRRSPRAHRQHDSRGLRVQRRDGSSPVRV